MPGTPLQVSKPVVIGALALIVVMVGVIAYLLGRESGRHHTVAAAPVPAPLAVAVGPGGTATYTPPANSAKTEAVPDLPANPFEAAQQPPPLPTAPPRRRPPPPVGEPDEAAQVHEYFLKVSEITVGGAGDPNEFANKLITSSLNGDSSGFDALITSSQSALSQAKALVAPAPCAAYHAKLVSMLEDTVAMMGTLKTGLASKNTDALTALMPQANALQSKTTALESEAREIKKQYGL